MIFKINTILLNLEINKKTKINNFQKIEIRQINK